MIKIPGAFNCEEYVFRPDTCPEYIEEEFDRRSGMPYQEWMMEQRYKKKMFEKKYYYKEYRKYLQTIIDRYLYETFDISHIHSLFSEFEQWLYQVTNYVFEYRLSVKPVLFWMDELPERYDEGKDQQGNDFQMRLPDWKVKKDMIEEANGCYIEAKFVVESISPFNTVKRPKIDIIIGEGQRGYPWDIMQEVENELKNNQ